MKVFIKWGKTKLEVDVDTSEPPAVFKAQIFALTGVLPEKQKIMVKGGTLKDDADWSTLGLKDGSMLMMVGSAEPAAPAVEAAPEAPVRFVEDMADADVASLATSLGPAGLTNLGNTCYMAATVQVLHALPELREVLRRFPPPGHAVGTEPAGKLTAALRDLSLQLAQAHSPVAPWAFLQVLHAAYPQFAQRQNGMLMQQDADECWSQLFHAMSTKLPQIEEAADAEMTPVDAAAPAEPAQRAQRQGTSALAQLFQGDFVVRTQLAGTEQPSKPESEPAAAAPPAADVAVSHDVFTKLSCHIGGQTNYLLDGLKASLDETLEKQGPDGQQRLYSKRSRLSRLPYYLAVQFVRFFWKADKKLKAKIVRPVEFPLELDVWELCDEPLQRQLEPARRRLAEIADQQAQQAKQSKQQQQQPQQPAKPLPADARVTLDARKLRNDTGKYELTAVLTHKGRDADSGHYVAWVKHADNLWMKFDDETVTSVTNDEIIKLSGKGGGDWHMAYMLFYKAKEVGECAALVS
eukprot:TRINITY_DN10763_c0_g1_i1.p1 TRINITY_DN10763_c0_g1~~TRINITY_DN10763_c0_g1_i1.p1  ORF type:complete len:565 (+),score=195.75 TRINITY_DN10763_c0_g1_i1:134-1696(+)